jgi:hypothetical protein
MMGELDMDILVKDPDWKQQIAVSLDYCDGDYTSKSFLDTIWNISQNSFDIPREIQVIIDKNGDTFCSVGTPGFVSFEGQEDELTKDKRLNLPMKCWIHTHPFGEAYFSGTDQRTINTWRMFLEDAIVIGFMQTARVNIKEGYTQITHYGDVGVEEE